MPTSRLTAAQLLWYTRGAHWDYDVLLVPTTFAKANWGEVVQALAHYETGSQIVGTVRDETGRARAFVGFVGVDALLRDERGSKIRQLVLWFPEGVAPESVSTDWWPNLRAAADSALSSSSVHRLSREDVEAAAEAGQSIGATVRTTLRAGIAELQVEILDMPPPREAVGPCPKSQAPHPQRGGEAPKAPGERVGGCSLWTGALMVVAGALVVGLWLLFRGPAGR